jgi:hypothetical protein
MAARRKISRAENFCAGTARHERFTARRMDHLLASITPRINKTDVTARELLDSAFRQNVDEVSPSI